MISLHLDRPLPGVEFCDGSVAEASTAGLRELHLFAVDLSVKLAGMPYSRRTRITEPTPRLGTLRAPESVQGPIRATAEELKRLIIQCTKRFGQCQMIGLEMLIPHV